MKNYKVMSLISYILLLLYSVNFEWLNDYLFFTLIILVVFTVGLKEFLRVDKMGLCIIVTFCTYFLIMYINGSLTNIRHEIMVFLVMPICAYLFSSRLKEIDLEIAKEEIYLVIIGIAFMNAIYGSLNYFMRIKTFGVSQWSFRYSVDFWNGSLVAPTNQGANFTLMASLFFWAILNLKKNKLVSITVIFFSTIAVICGFDTASRTILIIFLLMFLLNSLFYSSFRNDKLMRYILIVIIGCFIIVLYYNDFANIRTNMENSNLTQRMAQLEREGYSEGRFKRWKQVISQAPYYLFGDMPPSNWHAHNLWLDIYKDAGILPFFAFLGYTYHVLKDICLVIKSKIIDNSSKILMFSAVIGLLINFFVEPVLNAIPMIFCEFILITGYLHIYVNRVMIKRK